MPTILELRDEQTRLVAQARAKYDEITADTPEDRAAEIEREFDAIMAERGKIESQIERQGNLEAAERALEQIAAGQVPTHPDVRGTASIGETGQITYDQVFARALQHGAHNLNPEERQVLQGGFDPEARAQSTGTPAAGGYTVPTTLFGEIDKALAAWGPMWDGNIVRELNTPTGNPMTWPTIDDTAARGRIKAENAPVDDDGTDDVVLGQRALGAYVYDTGIVRIPMELLQDSVFNMESLMNMVFADRLARTCNDVLTTGTGANEPHGIVTASTLGVTAASAAAITADELKDFKHSVNRAYRSSPRCFWQFNDNTLLALSKLKDGQGNYIWTEANARTGDPATLLGKPYHINDSMADIGTGNRSMLFGDHSRYVVRKVNGFSVVTLRERYAEYMQIGMVGHKRFDGELVNTAAVRHLLHP